MALSPKRRAFCQEYVVDRNATQAYIRAGYSKNGASQGAERLLRNVEVRALIAELEEALAKRTELTAADVLAGIRGTAEVPVGEVPAATRLRSWELLGKYLGLWNEAAEAGSGESLVERLERLEGERNDG